jgi:hypothetical protein
MRKSLSFRTKKDTTFIKTAIMRTGFFQALALLLISLTVQAQKEGLKAINKIDLKAYMTFFASDEMKGRNTGTPENEIAALYLRTNIMRLGLKPIPETGDYLQSVPLESAEIKDNETYIKIKDSNGEEIYLTDSIIYLMAPSVTTDVTSKLVFAGYGFTDSTTGYDDYKDIEIKDKIVLIMTGSPHSTDMDEVNAVLNMDVESKKIMLAFSKGARAILLVYDPRSKYPDAYASGLADIFPSRVGTKMLSLKMNEGSAPVQIAFVTRNTADNLMKKSGYDLRRLQEKIVEEKKPASIELSDITVTFRTYIDKSDITVNNVIGMVEGSDPLLKNECIIYTAHFDHVGVNQEGEAFNGADDNASGSMALLEVAQAFMNLKKKPLRTIVFAWVNGEEKGLLGSEFYVSDPVVPLEKTLININLDMVGRSKMPSDTGKFMGIDVNVSEQGEILLYTDQKGNDILDLINSKSKLAGIKTLNMGKDPLLGSSDYASFMSHGVPAIFFNSGDYPDLHSTRDDVEKIDFDKMERVSKMVFLVGYDIANKKKRFVPVTVF